MAELAPGLMVTRFSEPGTVYVFNTALLGVADHPSGRAVAIHEDDWRRIPPADRERLLDEMTRDAAAWGTERLADWLRGACL